MARGAQYRSQAKTLREERKKLWEQAKTIVDKAESEKRPMRSDEKGSWDEVMKEMDALHERVSALERQADEADKDEEADDKDEDRKKRKKRDEGEEGADEDRDEDKDEDRDEDDERGTRPRWIEKDGRRFLVVPDRKEARNRTQPGGGEARTFERRAGETDGEYRSRCRRSTKDYTRVFFEYMYRGESALNTPLARRAIQADSDIVGGYLVAPQEFTARLIKFVNNVVFVRKLATVATLKSAQSLGAPSLDTDISDADWTSELDTGTEDNAMAFGKRELTPHPLAKRIKISNKLLRMAAISGGASADNSVAGGGAEGLVRDRLGYKFGVTEEKAFLLGSGSNQPLGVFVSSSRGIDTSRDVLTGNSTGFTADGLIAAKYNQKVQYWPRLQWCFHRSALQLIRQLKDANGQYLWVPGGLGGEADKLLEFPVNMSEYAPNTFTTGQYVGLLGDWSFYWIADAENLEIQRLNELYAAANMTGFIARRELDGMPVLAEAFTRLKTN